MTKFYNSWPSVPAHLKTKTQLAALGLRPAPGQPVAAYKNGQQKWPLYDVAQAESKRQPTPAQLAALEHARACGELRRTCSECGDVLRPGKRLRFGLCADCRARRKRDGGTA